jgi:hypothetical protein
MNSIASPPLSQRRQLKTFFWRWMPNRSSPPHFGHGPTSSAPVLRSLLRCAPSTCAMGTARACSMRWSVGSGIGTLFQSASYLTGKTFGLSAQFCGSPRFSRSARTGFRPPAIPPRARPNAPVLEICPVTHANKSCCAIAPCGSLRLEVSVSNRPCCALLDARRNMADS